METFPRNIDNEADYTNEVVDQHPETHDYDAHEQEASQEQDSWMVRTKLGRLALRLVTDPIVAINAGAWSLHATAHLNNPNPINVGFMAATAAIGTGRAAGIIHNHFGELEESQTPAVHEQPIPS